MGKFGLILFIFFNASFIFLLFSPYIPNLIGKFQDDILLDQCDDRIQKYRTGKIMIQLLFSNGTPLTNYNITYKHIRHEFHFGCNIFSFDSFNGAQYAGYNESYRIYFKNLFNYAVLPFYWRIYEPEKGVFPKEKWLNNTLDWCLKNNITTKGHPLLWTREAGIPDWISLENDTLVYYMIQNRVSSIVHKYRGKIQNWDVVNEPAHTRTFAGLSTYDYVSHSLSWAHQANPNAQLTINDYGIIGHDFGTGPFFNLLKQIISNNCPINYIGLQSHEPRTDWIPATEIWASFEAYSRLGKPLYITEFEPISSPVPITNSWKKGVWSEENQAEYARRFYTIAFSHPSVKGIIWWDLSDLTSWLEGGGLLRSDMTPKRVYNVLYDLIHNKWSTKGSQLSNGSGWIEFYGFYGTYNITVQNLGYEFQINAKMNQNNKFIIFV